MNIDIQKAKEQFVQYTQEYDLSNLKIGSRQTHSFRVMELSKLIAEKLELTQEEIELATLIGLLHDIARFEQYTQYKTFWDKISFDHGDFGVKILEKDIRKYIETDKYDKLIKTAVKNHNKYKIEEGLSERELLFSKLIRDADKIDILYEAIQIFNMKENEIHMIENSEIPLDTFEEFKTNKLKDRNKRTHEYTPIDGVLETIMFIFDINFKSSFEVLKENDYVNKLVNRYDFKLEKTKEQMEEIRLIANNYIANKLQ